MKKTPVFIILFAVAITIVFIILNKDMKTRNINTDKMFSIRRNIEFIYKNNSTHIDTSSIQKYRDSTYNSLSERIKSNTQFVFYVPENYCNDCFIQEYNKLMKMPTKMQRNTIILTSFEKNRDVRLWVKDKEIKYPIYNCSDKSFLQEIASRGKISFFTVDTTYTLKHLYIPIIFIPEQSEEYYNFIKNNIFNINIEELSINNTKADIVKKKHDFGNISLGDTVFTEFSIKNIGDEPLVIKRVDSSCDCTITEWERKPVAPNTETIIKVKYAAYKIGSFSKRISVSTNTENGIIQFTIYGNVTN
ncbi:DUF1573 domain-containing protein [Parabacteroides sp. AM08-6]|uniref:DUF1573 domain-containing protein n=1 Tax=Parabacteroides sp. AM08-6 TaxID=2292053 RepID=UPI000EFE4563|nr:DUF1573 domain-containing protein [Parabacteroides sp. AM08-6]RHJ84855.1 DUF1573 domain-containing protein [Parabacteroides sp. AM08-6]